MATLIDGFRIDATVSEEPSYSAEVTAHPVEKGADIVDHVRARPVTLSITGIVSDTPLQPLASERDGTTLPTETARKRLREIYTNREPVAVETDDTVYENMILETLSIPRDSTTGDALRFSATFRQVEFVTNERTTVRVAVPRASSKSDRGSKPTSAVEPSKTYERQRQFQNKVRKQYGLTHDPTLGTDLL